LKFFIDNWHLFLLAFVSGGMLLWPMVRGGGRAGSVPTTEAVRLINREKAVLIDIREPSEFATGHAVGSRNVPLAALPSSKDLPGNKSLPVIVVCATGNRASRGVDALRKLGYDNAKALAGGVAAWREASLPVEKTAA
jgi:rhodanese-related sulfurtransferase